MSENNSETSGGGEQPKATVTPSRKAYSSVASDVSVHSATGELLDNSLDSAALETISPVEVEIEIRSTDDGDEEFVYRDNAGGVKEGEMGVFLGLGRSREDRAADQNVGTFGIGAKKALKRLGDRLIIASRHQRAEQGWQYTVDPEWFEVRDEEDDPTEWEFPMEPVDLDAGSTELRIQEVSFDWDHIKDDVIDWISTTYRKFLSEESNVGLLLDLTIIDARGEETTETEVSPPPEVEWSYAPWFKGAHPRKFAGLKFADEEWSAPITARVTVGLLRQGSNEQAGTFIYCQNRLIESNLTNEKGGFGITNDSLNQFSLATHKRLRIEIELFGDASDLPWNSDKSRIRKNHKALSYTSRGVYWWLRRMADRHMSAGKFGTVSHSPAVFDPYPADSPYAKHHKPEEVNIGKKQRRLKQGKISQIRIYEKPGTDYSIIEDIADFARGHAHLGIRASSMEDIGFDDWAEPTYNALLGYFFKQAFYDYDAGTINEIGTELLTTDDIDALLKEINRDAEDRSEYYRWAAVAEYLTVVEELPPITEWSVDEGEKDEIAKEVSRLHRAAAEDLDHSERLTDLVAWRHPRYDAEFDVMAARRGVDLEEIEPISESLIPGASTDDEDDGSESDRSSTQGSTPGVTPSAGDMGAILDCPECGAEMSDNTCSECGFEYESTGTEDDESSVDTVGTSDVFAGSGDDASPSGSGDTGAADDPDDLSFTDFVKKYDELLGDVPEEAYEDDAEAFEYLVSYLTELNKKLETAENFVDLDQLTEMSTQPGEAD